MASLETKSEGEFTPDALLRTVSEGDEAAFGVLFRYYSDKLYEFAFTIVRNSQLADDIVQEVFLKIWTRRTQLTSITNFDGYLYKATRNRTLDCLEKIARETTARQSAAEFIHLEKGAYTLDEEERLAHNEQELRAAIDNLSPQQRMAFDLCQVDGLKYEEAAQQMNISKMTVKAHVANARRSLRKQLSEKLGRSFSKEDPKSSEKEEEEKSQALKISLKLGAILFFGFLF